MKSMETMLHDFKEREMNHNVVVKVLRRVGIDVCYLDFLYKLLFSVYLQLRFEDMLWCCQVQVHDIVKSSLNVSPTRDIFVKIQTRPMPSSEYSVVKWEYQD